MGTYIKGISKHIITISPEGKDYSVDPYVLQAKKLDIVYFQNVSKTESISIFFPEKNLFDVSVIEKLGPGASIPLTVKSEVTDSYPYFVYVHGFEDFASKEAAPRIIVYDDLE